MKNTKRERIEELTKELHNLTNKEKGKQEQKKEARELEKQPGEDLPQEQPGEQPPKKSIFQRLGPIESDNGNGRQEHYSSEQERGRPELSQRF